MASVPPWKAVVDLWTDAMHGNPWLEKIKASGEPGSTNQKAKLTCTKNTKIV